MVITNIVIVKRIIEIIKKNEIKQKPRQDEELIYLQLRLLFKILNKFNGTCIVFFLLNHLFLESYKINKFNLKKTFLIQKGINSTFKKIYKKDCIV